MTAHEILQFSLQAEPFVFLCFAVSIPVLIWALGERYPKPVTDNRSTAERLESALVPRVERRLLVAILLIALTLRLWGWNSALTAPWWFTQIEAIDVTAALRRGDIFAQIISLLREFHGRSVTQSPILLPAAIFVQTLIGPSSASPVIAGGVIGTAMVALYWLLARQTLSKVFGLLAAALVAVSPLQIVWSRTGGVQYLVGVGILAAIFAAFTAGKRHSIFLTIFAALITWCCLYLYYAARIAFPLSCLALALGVSRARGTLWITIKLATVMILIWSALYFALPTRDFKPTFWPFTPGYVGNKAESTVTELIERNVASVSSEVKLMLQTYFLFGRASDLVAAEQRYHNGEIWGLDRGGLCLLPVALLGIVGVLCAIRNFSYHSLWLAMTLLGLAIVAMSQTVARRIAVFDEGWCAMAALGLLALIEAPGLRRLSTPALSSLLGATLLLFGCWSFGSITILNRALPASPAGIPFGQGFYGDGCTCIGCYEAGKRWKEEFKRDISVVLFDSDRAREYVTCPGGLGLYGRLASLPHSTDRFFEFYPIWRNLNYRWEENSLYPVGSDPIEYLIQQLRLARSSEIEWHFEVPTQWERWLAEELISVGGTRVSFHSPLSRTESFIIRTTFAQREKVFQILRERLRPDSPQYEACLELSDEGGESFLPQPIIVAPFALPETKNARPSWIVSTGTSVNIDSETVTTESIIAAAPDTETAPKNETAAVSATPARPRAVQLLAHNRYPEFLRYDLSERKLQGIERSSVSPVGVGCAAYVLSDWWVADPITGAVRSTGDASWLPQGKWLGIASFGESGLILASRDQELEIFDVSSKRSVNRFPATLIPSFERGYGECVGVAAGESWIATANFSSSLITLYTDHGTRIGSFSLARYLKLPAPNIMNIAGMGSALGIVVGFDKSVRTILMGVHPDLNACSAAPQEEQEKLYQREARRLALDRIEPESASQDWGVPTADRTVSNELLRVGGITYRHGIGVHANSRLAFELGGNYSTFEAAVGLPDHITSTHPASVIFRVIGDGRTLWDSGVIRAGTGSKPVRTSIQDIKLLELVVTDAGDGIQYDHACWLDPKLSPTIP